ncbi:MAG: CoA-binding protein [Gemmatimonadaceae bacterium]
MTRIPASIEQFLRARRIAVAGVSRDSRQPANAIFRRLRDSGHDVVPVNPGAASLEGATCYPDLASIPGEVDALMMAAHPSVSVSLVREAAARGVGAVWFHRSIGDGSVSAEAVAEAERLGVQPIVGGCPLMYCEPVDPFHRCMCAVLRWTGRVPS